MKSPMGSLRGYLGGEDPRPVIAMFGLNTADLLDTNAFTWVAPTIAASFHKHVADFALITVLSIVIAPILAVPVSLAADRRSRLPIAIACAVVWGSFSILTSLSYAIWVLIIARVGCSLGQTVSYPVQLSLMGDYYSPTVRARAFAVQSMSNGAGNILGAALGGGVTALFGWRVAFYVLTIPTVYFIIYTRKVREPQRGAFERIMVEKPQDLREAFGRLYAIRSLRYIWFAGIWFFGITVSSAVTLPFYFKDVFGIGAGGVGAVGAVGGGAGMFAGLYGARIAQRHLNEDAGKGVRWIAQIAFAIAALLVIFAVGRTLWIAVPMVVIISAIAGLALPLFSAITTLISPPELRSTAYTIGQIFGLGGAFLGLIVAAVAQGYGYVWAFLVVAVIAVRSAFHLVTASGFVNDDVQRLSPEYVDATSRVDSDGRSIVLETKGLTVHYDGVQVLFGVDIAVREGEILALLGTNGAGKSTVLNAVCGLVEPSGGNVWLDGVAITAETAERTAAQGLLQAPGGRGIFPGLTVAENLSMGAFLLRGDKALAAQRTEAVLEVFPALRPLLGLKAGALSGGQRQQLVLAQAFLLKPRVLLIDELSLGLAPVIVQDLLEAVRRLNAEGVTIVLVEQSVNVALTLADRAYFLEKGEVRFEGPTAELLARPDLLRSVFLGGAARATAAK